MSEKIQKQNKLEILIVDDRKENRNTAKAALENKAEIDFATNYEDGMEKLQTKVYAFGIFDLELPRSKSNPTLGYYGFLLAKEASKYALDGAIVTSGTDHRYCITAFVNYCWFWNPAKYDMGIEEAVRLCNHGLEKYLPSWGFEELIRMPKTSPEAWKTIYETLLSKNENIKEIVEAKKRFFKYTGKMYLWK